MKKLILLAFVAFTFSCSSDDSTPPTTTIPPTTTEPTTVAFARGKMNNVPFDYTFNNVANDNFLHNSITGYSGLGDMRWYYYGGSFTKFDPPTFAPELMMAWDNVFTGNGGGNDGETEAFYETTNALPTNYITSEENENHVAGFSVQFKNEAGGMYSSIYGSQTGSTVVVQGSSQSTAGGLKRKTVWGTFSCKVYSQDSPSESISITDGTYKMILTEFN